MSDARTINDRYTAAVNARDLDTIRELFAPEGRIEEPAGSFVGRDAVGEYWEGFFEAFPDLKVTDVLTAEAGDTVLNEWSFEGTHSGPLQTPEATIPATGKQLRMRGADVVEVRNGLIQSHRAHYDQLDFMTQLGLVPEGVATA